MDELVIAKKSDLVEIADAIRHKTETSETLSLDEMVVSINELASEPALTTLIVNPGKDEQHITPPGTFDGFSDVVVAGDADLIAENIKSGVTIFNVAGSFEGGPNLSVMGGTTQPAGTENMVWINTDTEISSYAFSVTEPVNPVEGMVWVWMALNSMVTINVDKKNIVMLYPYDCKQYINGAWVAKKGKVNINNSWVDIDPALRIMWNGVYDNTVTNGWSGAQKRFESSDRYFLTPTITKTSKSLKFHMTGPDYHIYNGCVLSKDDIDFTNFKKITFKGTTNGATNQKVVLSVMNRNSTYIVSNAVASVYAINSADNTNFDVTLDVSKVTGEYALAIGLQVQNLSTITVNVTEFVLE